VVCLPLRPQISGKDKIKVTNAGEQDDDDDDDDDGKKK
jgi:hypothetical protein